MVRIRELDSSFHGMLLRMLEHPTDRVIACVYGGSVAAEDALEPHAARTVSQRLASCEVVSPLEARDAGWTAAIMRSPCGRKITFAA